MSRRANHRGWIVLESIPSDDGSLCVDFFEDPGGGFGFEHFRSDPEDGGRWTAIGRFGSTRHETIADALMAARAGVTWLSSGQAHRMLQEWQSSVS